MSSTEAANRTAERAHHRSDARLAWREGVLLGLGIGLILGAWLVAR